MTNKNEPKKSIRTRLSSLWNKVHSEREPEVAMAIMIKAIGDEFFNLSNRLDALESKSPPKETSGNKCIFKMDGKVYEMSEEDVIKFRADDAKRKWNDPLLRNEDYPSFREVPSSEPKIDLSFVIDMLHNMSDYDSQPPTDWLGRPKKNCGQEEANKRVASMKAAIAILTAHEAKEVK